MGQPQDDWRKILFSLCSKLGVDPIVFGAIITIESAWDPKAMRFEEAFIYLEKPQEFCLLTKRSLATERALQRFSYGLCQLMGANARAMGFTGDLLDLREPTVNLEWGLKFFLKRCGGYTHARDQAAAWNWGSVKLLADGRYINQVYVDKFIQSYNPALQASKKELPVSAQP